MSSGFRLRSTTPKPTVHVAITSIEVSTTRMTLEDVTIIDVHIKPIEIHKVLNYGNARGEPLHYFGGQLALRVVSCSDEFNKSSAN